MEKKTQIDLVDIKKHFTVKVDYLTEKSKIIFSILKTSLITRVKTSYYRNNISQNQKYKFYGSPVFHY